MEYKDYYKILGVDRDADKDAIKRSYRRLARKYHPDVSKEADAEARFKEIGEAYEVLSDPEKRSAYDQLGANWRQGQDFRPPPGWQQQRRHAAGGGFDGGGFDGAADFSDFFDSLFGGGGGPFERGGGFHGRSRRAPPRGGDHRAAITVSLREAYEGVSRTLNLSDGQGATRKLRVKIPAGVTDGQTIRLAGQGQPGPGGSGDLLLTVSIAPHPHLHVDGRDVHLDLPITPWEAALGAQLKVPTLGGWVDMRIPAGAQSGQKLRLKGRGLPGKPPGSQLVTLKLVTPRAETDEARAFYERMREELPLNPREKLTL